MIDHDRVEMGRYASRRAFIRATGAGSAILVCLVMLSSAFFDAPLPRTMATFPLLVVGLATVFAICLYERRVARLLKQRIRDADRLVCPYCWYHVGESFDERCPECGECYTARDMRGYWDNELRR